LSIAQPYRTLIIDDDLAIHEVFASVLAFMPLAGTLGTLSAGDPLIRSDFPRFEVHSAYSGEQGLEFVRKARAGNWPYAMAFLDMRMPGWDGIETIGHIWRECPDLQIIICTGYSDFSWHEIIRRYGHTDRLLMLKKPFDVMELRQLAYALAVKWNLINHLQTLVTDRTVTLQTTNLFLQREIVEHEQAQADLRKERDYIDQIIKGTPAMVVGIAPDGRATFINPSVSQSTGYSPEEIIGKNWWNLLFTEDSVVQVGKLHSGLQQGPVRDYEMVLTGRGGQKRTVNWNFINKLNDKGQLTEIIGFGNDITEKKEAERERQVMEMQRRHAHKLESIGQLAAGIAHEINTPTQYIGDNIRFLQSSFERLRRLHVHYRDLLRAARQNDLSGDLAAEIDKTIDEADADFCTAEIPEAICQSLSGLEVVARIVRSMRDFSHPGTGQKIPTDINQAIEATLVVCGNEWKKTAVIVKDFDPSLPAIPCLAGEFNQVILNLVVNAAHAIADAAGKNRKERGTITLSTRGNGSWVEIQVRDTGVGIPEDIREKVFDPFFTTRPFGKCTGQGLAIARNVIVNRHNGTLTFQTEMGAGTTFIIRLPMAPEPNGVPVVNPP
jgi:two-component system, NtrC family, sensor kinase